MNIAYSRLGDSNHVGQVFDHCPACQNIGRIDAAFSAQNRYPLYHCKSCGLGSLKIEDELQAGFDEYWTEINQAIYAEPMVVEELSEKYRSYFARVASTVPNMRFLDVGSGAGTSIRTAADMGFEVMGVEPSEKAVSLSRRLYGLPVVQGLLQADDALPKDYGALALWDVIEHVSDPEALVQACHQHLVPGGALLLETPDEGTVLRSIIRFFGRLHLNGFDPRGAIYYRAHRYYFTREAMTQLLSRCGFTEIRFFAERTMYQKELRKKKLYEGLTPQREMLLRVAFFMLKHLPFMANKMVVIATKKSN